MADINKLKDQLDQARKQTRRLLDEHSKIVEERELTDEEDAEIEALESKQNRLVKQIEREERQQSMEVAIAAARSDDDSEEERGVKVGEDRETLKPFRCLGEQMIAIKRAVESYGRVMDKRLLTNRVDAEGRAITGASEQVAADGGWLVQKDLAAGVMTKTFEMGQVLSRLDPIPVSGNGLKINAVDETSRANGSRFGGVQAYWIGEGDPLTGTKPKFRQIQLDLKKLAALFYATSEVLEDADALSAIAERGFQEELTFKLEDAVFRGNGGALPLGFLNANCKVSVAKETGQAASTIVADNILNMWMRLFARSRPNAAWFINQDCEPQLAKLAIPVGTGGALVYMPAGGLSGSPFATLYGRPVIPVEYADTVGTEGDVCLVDLAQYVFIRKGGVRADSSIHVQFTNDEVVFRWILRADGQPWWTSALTPFKGSNTQSPFITLADRS